MVGAPFHDLDMRDMRETLSRTKDSCLSHENNHRPFYNFLGRNSRCMRAEHYALVGDARFNPVSEGQRVPG
ncbi:hypothetical protein HZS92_04665 [Xanthomonas citri pv. citri]|nr:hypothetical protein HZS92_04665 [Xanthomonas citri pv. citri]CEE26153.1 hypothetical protein XAC9322_410004 [Xanthomonas citri pv. citri]CEE87371.1 hypothetical protein XACLE20_720004 [Xanthomonas citri pv. citri]CEF36604.1 hypothetical protein XAC40_490004 [Xanthomonas citri pv. citri]CEH42126.1 hypothetical protein XACLE3_3950002 [Xanthomonas citri pv. citri]